MRFPAEQQFLRIVTLITILSIAFFLVRLIPYGKRPTAGFMAYFTAGKLLATHGDMDILYEGKKFHDSIPLLTNSSVEDEYRSNTPLLAIFFLPLSVFSVSYAKLVWEIFSFIAVLVSLVLVQRSFKLKKIEWLVYTSLTFSFTPLYISFVYGQLYGVLLLLHVALLFFWKQNKLFAASVPLALLLMLKGYGVLFLILALFFKQGRLVAYTLLNYLIVAIVTLPFIGISPWSGYLGSLKAMITAPPMAGTIQQNIQSYLKFLFDTIGHLVTTRTEWSIFGQLLVIVLFIVGIFLLFRSSARRVDITVPYSVAIIIGVLFAPQLFDYHYAFFLIPLLVCYEELTPSAARKDLILFGISLFLLSVKIPYYYAIFQHPWLGFLGFPRIYGGILLLWLLYTLGRNNPLRQIN